jgi:very-short-patch-repair endonuclease
MSPNVKGAMAAQTRGNSIDELIATLAGRQHGVVARPQLINAGIGGDAIRHRLKRDRLHRIHRGVYAVGHTVMSMAAFRMAAVLAAGPGAALSHRAAAMHLGLLWSDVIEVTVERGRRPLEDIRIHQLPLPPDEVISVHAMPVKSVSRTLFDLAAVVPRRLVERAIHEVDYHRHTDPPSLADIAARYPRRHGIVTIRAILADRSVGVNLTRSELEERFLVVLENYGLPRPEVNASVQIAGLWIECDCLWRDRRVIIELDGRAAHGTIAAFERDRARDRMLQARGWRVVRVTWRQLHDDPDAVVYDLRALLSSSGETAPARSTSQVPSVSKRLRSTTVDATPGSSPPSSTRSAAERSSSGTSASVRGSGPPARFALV